MVRKSNESKAELAAREVAKLVNAGKAWDLETPDFSDANRSPTCLEVDFPIAPINEIAIIEGNALKPVYKIGKWWAGRRSSIFRALLIAAAIPAPKDKSETAKLIWGLYFGNFLKKSPFKNIRVVDIFSGGGTTLVEGSRLGFKVSGIDLNPISWFVSKQRSSSVSQEKVTELLQTLQETVKPLLTPFYTANCPRGHLGKWTNRISGEKLPADFSPLTISSKSFKDYRYEGPEILYAFWAKHGLCQNSGCGHRTPIISTPVIATKSLSVRYLDRRCSRCMMTYHLEERDPRMAPGAPLFLSPSEQKFATVNALGVSCPHCAELDQGYLADFSQAKKKTIPLTLILHPSWIKGSSSTDGNDATLGGSATDSGESTVAWNSHRAKSLHFIEVRGTLPGKVVCPETNESIQTGPEGGTVGARGKFVCGGCGKLQSLSDSISNSKTTAQETVYAVQGYCPECDSNSEPYGGKFFTRDSIEEGLNAATEEWERRKNDDLSNFWPQNPIEFSHMTHQRDPLPKYGYDHWWKMFNPRQLLGHALLFKAYSDLTESPEKEFSLLALQQFLQNQNMFSIWHKSRDHFAAALSDRNFHPKSTAIEIGTFCPKGYGPWGSVSRTILEAVKWKENPHELVPNSMAADRNPSIRNILSGKSTKVFPGDASRASVSVSCQSSTDLESIKTSSVDLVITDPPFGGNIQYAELSDFFYVWLRLVLKLTYQNLFSTDCTPKALEAVSNRARHPENPDSFFQKLLTQCFKEASRILKPGGLLAFTFHHSEDEPWVAVLESLFDAGFSLCTTYPIRSDETKGSGEFGSRKVEYDIIHVCRKRTEDPEPISWAKLRRKVLEDVRELQELLEHHQEDGLPDADLKVIRRGKALEYFSRHYGQVFKDEGKPISVLEALVGINQLLDEEDAGIKEAPPHNAEPFTRMLLRLFDGKSDLARDQMQKFLRGTGISGSDFEKRGWVTEKQKIFYLVDPLDMAQDWQGRHRKSMTSDYDQASFLVGACVEGSGINIGDTLRNEKFRPHPALDKLLVWLKTHGGSKKIRDGASRASHIFKGWESKNQDPKSEQIKMFFAEDETE
ncbi:MAG: DUF1156 domain-containing protein [Planctomycetota bacterium]